MSTKYKEFGLQFLNSTTPFNSVSKICKSESLTSAELAYFLFQCQYPVDITEEFLPRINNVLQGDPEDNIINSGSSYAEIDNSNTKIVSSNTLTQTLPTLDFKELLEEYLQFLTTPPLNGTKVK